MRVSEQETDDHRRFLTVRVGPEWFAIDSEVILEVIEDGSLQPVPSTDPGILGLLRWRGRWLPTASAAQALGVQREDAAQIPPVLVVLGRGAAQMAVAFDAVGAVRRFDAGNSVPAELLSPSPGVRTVVQANDEFVSVIEADILFTLESDRSTVASTTHLEEKSQIVTFRIADQEFGISVFNVQEIVRPEGVTRVPEAPEFVEGVMDLRGVLVPVVDLRKRLETPATDTDTRRIVIVPYQQETLGLIVDEVSEVLSVSQSDLTDPPAYVRGISAKYVEKMARVNERLIVILDTDSVLSSSERIQLEEADWKALVDEGEDEA